MRIAIVDYGMGNLRSVTKKLSKIGFDSLITSKPEDIELSDKLILPGVGHFEKGMQNLKSQGLIEPIRKFALEDKKPILGICLGMQMLTDFSEEGETEGLGFIKAKTKKFNFPDKKLKVPHMGWNSITSKNSHPILNGISENEMFYFVHSYYVKCDLGLNEIAQTTYGLEFSSIIADKNIIGVQFHPEKSHEWGEHLIKNFCGM
ncbi:MAG: Imidazole glycerol phosphate synthase subunit HisH [Ignavibacteriaceae bacterium]|nr:Imidazole glycerol phosphate synthase subunit HisH [Ignavibacteriaceae bacterium]